MAAVSTASAPGGAATARRLVQALLVVITVSTLLYFLRTGDPAILILGLLLAVGIGLAYWVYNDARRLDMPAAMWALVVFIAPALGVVGYLIARELVRRDR